MDIIEQDYSTASTHLKTNEEDDSHWYYTPKNKQTILRMEEEEEKPRTLVYDNDLVRNNLNTLIQRSVSKNKQNIEQELGYPDGSLPPLVTAYFAYFPGTLTSRFFDAYDEKRMNYTPRRTRRSEWYLDTSLTTACGLICSAAPYAAIPPLMWGIGYLLHAIDPHRKSGAGDAFGYTMAGLMVPSCFFYGCKWAKDIKDAGNRTANVIFGIKSNDPDEPQEFIIPYHVKWIHRTISFATFGLRAAPAIAFLWSIESKVVRYTHSLDGFYWAAVFSTSYIVGYLKKSYDFSMDSLERAFFEKKNKELKVEGIKKLLTHHLKTLYLLSPEVRGHLLKEYKKIIREKNLCKEIADIIANETDDEERTSYCGHLMDLIYTYFGYKKTNKERLIDLLHNYVRVELKENPISDLLMTKVKNAISTYIDDINLENEFSPSQAINAFIQNSIKNITFENELSLNINNNEKIYEIIYNYITKSNLEEDKTLKKEDNALINLIADNQDLLSVLADNEYNEKIQHIMDAAGKIKKEWGEGEAPDLAKSATSLLFTKYFNPVNYTERFTALEKKATSITGSHLEETTELLDVAKTLESNHIEGMNRRLFDEDHLPPDPSTYSRVAYFSQGIAGLGRFTGTLFPFRSIVTNPALFWIGPMFAFADIPLRYIEERYVQEQYFTNHINYITRPSKILLHDFWPVRAGLALWSYAPTFMSFLGNTGIIFTMCAVFADDIPVYFPIMLSSFSFMADMASNFIFHNTNLQDGWTSIVTCNLPERIEDNLPTWLKEAREGAEFNMIQKELEKEIFKSDKPTIKKIYEAIAGIEIKEKIENKDFEEESDEAKEILINRKNSQEEI